MKSNHCLIMAFAPLFLAMTALLTPVRAWADSLPIEIRAASQDLLTDSLSGSTFKKNLRVGKKEFRCLGAGGHKKFFYKIYANVFCIEASASLEQIYEYIRSNYSHLSKNTLARALEGDDRFFSLLADLPGDKLLQIRFLRSLTREQISDAMAKAMRPHLPSEDVERVAKAFRARDPAKGQLALVYSEGEALHLLMGNSRRRVDGAPLIVQKIWSVWLENETPTPNLRRDLAQRLAAEYEMASGF